MHDWLKSKTSSKATSTAIVFPFSRALSAWSIPAIPSWNPTYRVIPHRLAAAALFSDKSIDFRTLLINNGNDSEENSGGARCFSAVQVKFARHRP